MVWFDIRYEQKKRIIALRINITNRRIGNGIDSITGQMNLLLVVIVEDCIIGIRSKFKNIGRQPILIAETRRGRHGSLGLRFMQMPLTDITGIVPRIGKIMREGPTIIR